MLNFPCLKNLVFSRTDICSVKISEMGQKKEECVRVIMRCRPMAQKEIDAGHKSIIEVDQKRCEVITIFIQGSLVIRAYFWFFY